MIGVMSQGQPAACTTMIAAVFGVIASSIESAVMFPLIGSMSAKTGIAP